MSVNQKLAQKIENLKANSPQSVTEPTQTNPNQNEQLPKVKMDWNRESLDFGTVAPGSKQDYSFTYLGDKKIIKVTAGCGCTSVIQEGNKVTGVLLIGSDFSYSNTNLIETRKTVTAQFEDLTSQTLVLECTVDKTLNIQ